MNAVSMDNNWTKSRAHLHLLAEFLQPRPTDFYDDTLVIARWTEELKEPLSTALERFRSGNFITEAHVQQKLEFSYSLSEMKSILRKQKLPVSGIKTDLARRLCESLPTEVQTMVADVQLLVCSEKGKAIAQKYEKWADDLELKVQTKTLEYVRERKFVEAYRLFADYDRRQVFPIIANIKTAGFDCEFFASNELVWIFKGTPKVLSYISGEHLEGVRLAAAMYRIWGKQDYARWFPNERTTGMSIKFSIAVDLLLTYVSFLKGMDWYEKNPNPAKQLRVVAYHKDACEACKAAAARSYGPSNVPELPYQGCTHEHGCRCVLSTEPS
jgi:hypothetical protein